MDAEQTAKTNGQKAKRRLLRSPNYPAVSLGEAIARAKIIYDHEKKAETTAGVILKHLGYGEQASGAGGRALSALKQYGLLEEHSGNYRVSEAAFTLLHYPEGSPEREAALKGAAQKPALFRELLAAYKDGLPSDATLKSYLMRKGFNPTSIDPFIRIFRQTIELAKLTPGQYDGMEELMGEEPTMPNAEEQTPTQFKTPSSPISTPEMRLFSWHLSIPRNVRAELRLYGRDFRREDVERLKKQLELLEEAFEETSTEEE